MTASERLWIVLTVAMLTLAGSSAGIVCGSSVFGVGLLALAVPWHRQPLWSWAALYLRRHRGVVLSPPSTAVNDRCAGGVRYQGDVAAVAVQILGRAYVPTLLTGSNSSRTTNTLDVARLAPLLDQGLGLRLDSISLISTGSRRRNAGDYAAVYDTLIGTPPYAGMRETWLVVRMRGLGNADSLKFRPSVGSAAVAAAQRIAADFRRQGIHAKVASSAEMLTLEGKLGGPELSHRHNWRSVRGDAGWLTTYAYKSADITTEALAQAWSLRVDGVTSNITVFPDRTATATLTVRSAQPPKEPPNARLLTMPGEQTDAIAAAMCAPFPRLLSIRRSPIPDSLTVPIGPSGVLIGKTAAGERLLVPMASPGEPSRVHIAADDTIAKRLIIRAAAAGDRITVHTKDTARWERLRMPNIAVVDQARPVPGTTLSVVDGTIFPANRPNTTFVVSPRGAPVPTTPDVTIVQSTPTTVSISAAGITSEADVELFRAENRYTTSDPEATTLPELEFAE